MILIVKANEVRVNVAFFKIRFYGTANLLLVYKV